MTDHEIFLAWAEEGDNLSLYAEEGDRAGWEACRAREADLEDELERRGWGRPPYATGAGQLFAELGFDPAAPA